MSKDTRDKVTLSPEAYKVLEVEAMLQHISLKEAASKLIIKAACPKCLEILDIMDRPPKKSQDTITQEQKVTMEQEPKGAIAQYTKSTIAQEPNIIVPKEPNGQKAQVPYIPKTKGPEKKVKQPQLPKNQKAIAMIVDLWSAGERNKTKIASKIGYEKHVVTNLINKMIAKGELVK